MKQEHAIVAQSAFRMIYYRFRDTPKQEEKFGVACFKTQLL